MSNSKSINECEDCSQFYCQECSDAKEWHRFCSAACEREFEREKEREEQS
jgi:hypothetical protein